MDDKPSAIVIGGGLAGLTAGTILARAGWPVTVLEQHRIPGGLLQSFRRGPCRFETGFHFISDSGPGGCARAIAAHVGILDRLEFLEPDGDAVFVIHDQDREPIPLPLGLPRVAETLCERFPTQADGMAAFWRLVRESLGAKEWLSHLGVPGGEADETVPLSAVLDRCRLTGEARDTLIKLSGLVGIDQDCRFFAFAYIVGSAFAGPWRVTGGGDALIGALIASLEEAGGTLKLGADVTAIHREGRNITAVETADGERHSADVYLGSCHPAELVRLAGEAAFRPGFLRAVTGRPDGPGSFSVHARLRRHLPALGSSQHLLLDGAGRATYLVAPGNFEPDEEPTLELVNWMDAAEVAPWKDSRLHGRPEDYVAWKEERADELLAAVGGMIPGVVDHVVQRWTCSPLTFRDYTRARGGAALGFSQSAAHPALPLGIRGKLRNLFLVGQNMMLPGILGTLIGTTDTVGRMVGIDPIREVMGR